LCKRLAAFASLLLVFGAAATAAPPDVLDQSHPFVRAVMAAQAEVTEAWMQQSEVLGTAVGLDASAAPVLVVYVDRESDNASEVVRSFPANVRGVSVRVELTDKFRALARPSSGGGVDHKAKQTPPIKLGTSGGWRYDLANGYCCGGTLGSLVSIDGAPYILSNYHVLEADTVSGGNQRTALAGDPVIQPGLIDVSCVAENAQNVATLSGIKSLPGSNVDAAIAKVMENMVSATGEILGIGTISSQTVGASLNQKVKKSGRTTGLTRSTISGLNATINITYDNECAGGEAFTQKFTGQIVIANRGSKFLAGGDSGSLMVEDIDSNARSVGLLYAGSSTSGIANPIDEVLQFLKTATGATTVKMVGN
ncbi:MAG TPA: hypothetical protein VK993_09375, partial [Chthoniobacterales bacterium]|nr:hypothetical protein [Chthoniobacterales bacterium]